MEPKNIIEPVLSFLAMLLANRPPAEERRRRRIQKFRDRMERRKARAAERDYRKRMKQERRKNIHRDLRMKF